MKTKKQWVKKRHKFIQKAAKVFLFPFVKFKYGAKIIKCKDNRQRIILSNHQTSFDQFFIAFGYKAPIYYLASEDIFSIGLVSKLLKFAVNPIPIKKQTSDVRAVMNCMKVAKEGGSIAIFPEGNRTYSGCTEHISIAIVKLVKATKLPLTFFRIEGGYGVQPRWSDKVRKGKIQCYTSKTVEPEEYLKMTDEQLYALIQQELSVNENQISGQFKGKNSAEYLERAMYVCPYCGLSEFESNKDKIKCKLCNREIIYQDDKSLKGVGFDFPYNFVKEWYDYQVAFINSLNVNDYVDNPLYTDTVSLFNVKLYANKTLESESTRLSLYGNRLSVGELVLPFSEISAISVLGKNKLNIYYEDKVYQIKGDKRFNAVKYVNIFYRYNNMIKGDENVKFLGL